MKIFLFTLLTSLVFILGCLDNETTLPDKETTDDKSNNIEKSAEKSAIGDVKDSVRERHYDKCVLYNIRLEKEKYIDACKCYVDSFSNRMSLVDYILWVDDRGAYNEKYPIGSYRPIIKETEEKCSPLYVPSALVEQLLEALQDNKRKFGDKENSDKTRIEDRLRELGKKGYTVPEKYSP